MTHVTARLATLAAVAAACTAAAAPPAPQSDSCTSFDVPGTAIKHVHGDQKREGLDAKGCTAACCAVGLQNCTSWTLIAKANEAAGECFLKPVSSAVLRSHLIPLAGATTGCLNVHCPPTPTPGPGPPLPPPEPPLPPSLVRPQLTILRTIASIGQRLRDPTTAVFDPVNRSWHIWCSYKPNWSNHKGTGNASIYHFALHDEDINASTAWTPVGFALNASRVPGTFDVDTVYTPGAFRDCSNSSRGGGNDDGETTCQWFLFFGGERAGSSSEQIGLATAPSPFGPWTRHPGNPVFTPHDVNSHWCTGGTAARIDEIKALVLRGKKYVTIKSVCSNFTGLPIFYAPVDQSSWAPPYAPMLGDSQLDSPMFSSLNTCGRKGIEEPTFFIGPDSYLHFLGHDHGSCTEEGHGAYHHLYRSLTATGPRWLAGGHFTGDAQLHPLHEPNPVPRDGSGIFGDRPQTGVPEFWVDFGQTNAWDSNISLCSVEWVNASQQ